MISDEIRQKLQHIIRGDVLKGQEDHCTAIRNLLSKSFGSNPTVKREFESRSIVKEEQARFLKTYAQDKGLWMQSLPRLHPNRRSLSEDGQRNPKRLTEM